MINAIRSSKDKNFQKIFLLSLFLKILLRKDIFSPRTHYGENVDEFVKRALLHLHICISMLAAFHGDNLGVHRTFTDR
jgi:hypothetical protein